MLHSTKIMNIAIVAITKKGKEAALTIKKQIRGSKLYIPEKLRPLKPGKNKEYITFKGKLADLSEELFTGFEGIIFCMALGIVVRIISPYLKDKHTDPAVVSVDEETRFAVSVLSGHEGGANKLAIEVGNILGAEPVITTASESRKKIIVGVGCRRNTKKEEIIKIIKRALKKAGSSLNAVRYIATIDLKADERGLKEACKELGISLKFISYEMIKNFRGKYRRSSFVKEKIGVEGVSEPCALLASEKAKLIVPKIKSGGVTAAVAREN